LFETSVVYHDIISDYSECSGSVIEDDARSIQ
jgi:hypothetical protein